MRGIHSNSWCIHRWTVCRRASVSPLFHAVDPVSQEHLVRRFATYAFPVSTDKELSCSSSHARRSTPVATCDSSRCVGIPQWRDLCSSHSCVSPPFPIRFPARFPSSLRKWVSETPIFHRPNSLVCAYLLVETPSPSPCSREMVTTGDSEGCNPPPLKAKTLLCGI